MNPPQTYQLIIALISATLCATANADAPASEPKARLKEIERLAERWSPDKDDWTSERDAQEAGNQLSALSGHLKTGNFESSTFGDLFVPDAIISSINTTRLELNSIQDIRITGRSDDFKTHTTAHKPNVALKSMMGLHAGGRDIHIKTKVVSVKQRDDGGLSTGVFFQSSSVQQNGSRAQQNAEWNVDWTRAGDSKLRIRRIQMTNHSSVTWPGRPFVDCTRGVIRSDSDWHPQLSLGGEHWYGRIDAVGEINFMGHNGIAIGDVNNDGLDDLYVAQATGIPNKLFVQQPDGSVRETANESGVAWLDDTKGVLLLDIDNDGDQDLLCAIGPTIVCCANDGTGKFRPARSLRAASPASFYSLAAADYDQDGDLDIYACRYVKLRYGTSVPIPFHDANNGPANHLLRNDGAEGFTDVTHETGLHINNARFSLAASWADYDNDGDPDLYVANDFGRNNLYQNNNGRFKDVAAEAGVEDQAAGMGASWADFDRDGDLDLYVSNMFSSAGRRIAYQSRFMKDRSDQSRSAAQHHSLGNTLLANLGNGRFEDVSDRTGVRMGRWAWGSTFVDIDNNGLKDIVVPNGFLTNQYKDDL